jgi:NADH-quinone oxidoreductase subunit L
MKTYLLGIIFLPFLGAFILAAAGRNLSRKTVETIACASVLGSFLMATCAFFSPGPKTQMVPLFSWIHAGSFSAPMSVHWDALAAIMALMVTFVSSVIHLYSVGFMRDDEDYVRFFCYMNLFVFAMLVVTLADNMLFFYLGWEGVGFCSYALIGFWYTDVVKAAAGRKAFILTRIGDVAFGIAIAFFLFLFDDLSLSSINARAGMLSPAQASTLGFLLLWAAVGKSAQLPLAVWLPDAMAGPTPVSALIHAATMVTAGVYLLLTFFPILSLSPDVLLVTAVVGAVTALFAACAALAQRDIKRVLAYSTISQVSYMFLGVGAGDVTGSMFLLLSHAFFKALLFLAAGCVIQALYEEHDISRMGNLRRRLPGVFPLFLAGALSLGAIPPFGGFFSKDHILMATYSHPESVYKFLWGLGEFTALLTTLYTFRLFFLLFMGKPSQALDGALAMRDVRSIPRFMVWILWPLAILSLGAGALNLPGLFNGSEWLARYLAGVPGGVPLLKPRPGVEAAIIIISGLVSLIALLWSYFLYRRPTEGAVSPWRQGFEKLFFSGFYLNRVYEIVLVGPYQIIARFLWLKIDERIVDRGLEETSMILPGISTYFLLWTTGKISTYLKMLFLGFAAILGALAIGWYPW